ncbi:integrase arm-type DNA-binding domain-containing protein [Novosphingobium resinovorum]|uniref:tyrosine-type recombinase/integrase n=1 Tax=Novosphingobium TaxID=165696 RepID=UPI001B3C8F7F|nr:MULTISPECIES: integrase arm-type DNA-binding domain-containing protein [Novosphingobium]MBF7010566.1 integrase arm-type DNA-binding domain-containing protein [Novosphingobium sp. HR1a]WJM28565.1 integrase arm-type DNA-binding domain-containing protein [Novosphingobium resinovorum]
MGALSDAKVRGAKGTGKAYKLSDGEQLYLHVSAAGGRVWRMNYQFGRNAQGKPAQKTLTIGNYPAISLKDARDARDMAKSMLAKGTEPKPADLFARSAAPVDTRPTFQDVGRAWHTLQAKQWSKVHAKDVLESLENDVFPSLGQLPIADIEAPAVLAVLEKIVDRNAVETAHRVRQRISGIFVYGIAKNLAERDPAASLAVALPKKKKSKRQPAITELPALRQMLVDCEGERCRAQTKLAMRFLALTAVRSNEINGARWAEFEDLHGAEPLWRIPAHRMKGDLERKEDEEGDHLVPLAPQAVEVLTAMKPLTGDLDLVFPSDRHVHRQMSENTLRALLIRAGYYQRHVPHGFRSAFSTIMNERCERAWRSAGHKTASPDRAIIDLMLAHVPENDVEGAYNRAAYMPRRREIALEWANIVLADMWPAAIHIGQPMRFAATGPGRPGR